MVKKNATPLVRRPKAARKSWSLLAAVALVCALVGMSPGRPARAAAFFLDRADTLLPTYAAVENVAAAFGDYENNTLLDLVVTGTTSSGSPRTQFLRYDSSTSSFTPVLGHPLPDVDYGAVAWGDYDLDNEVDLLLAGRDSAGALHTTLKLYRNNEDTLVDSGVIFPGLEDTGLYWGTASWGDVDNDGDLDLLLTGATDTLATVSALYRNDGGAFSEIDAGLEGVYKSTASFVDFNGDGLLDIFLAGQSDRVGVFSALYQQTASGGFFRRYDDLPGVMLGSSDWGDYDADGDLDLLIAGLDDTFTPIARVYPNTGSGFGTAIALPVGVSRAAVAWADFDDSTDPAENDGRVDALVTGVNGSTQLPFSAIYRYDLTAGAFVALSGATPAGLARGAVLAGYLPNGTTTSGPLSFLLLGRTTGSAITGAAAYFSSPVDGVYNTPPQAPVLQPAVISADSTSPTGYRVTLSWAHTGDDFTPDAALLSNAWVAYEGIRLIVPPQSTHPLHRLVVDRGNAGANDFLILKGLPHVPDACPVYNWNANSIDASFSSSNVLPDAFFVVNRPPTAANVTLAIRAGQSLTVSAADLGIGDPDAGDLPTVTSFGAGGVGPQTVRSLTVALNPDGTSFTVTAPARLPAADLVSSDVPFTVSDACSGVTADGAGAGQATLTIQALNTAPVAVDDAANTNEETPVTIRVRANDLDANGQGLSLARASTPAHGTAVINADGTVTYTPVLNYTGTDRFTYTVSDGTAEATGTVDVTVAPVNDAPAFSGDPYSLAMDEDATGATGPVTAADVENAPLTFTLHAAPAYGRAVVDPVTGAFTYSPNENFTGDDGFEVRVAETGAPALADTARVNVSVRPLNDAPTSPGLTLTVPEDGSRTGVVVPMTDVDLPAQPLTFAVVTAPRHGDLMLAGATFDYTPDPNYHGPDGFTYVVSDGTAASAPAEATITVTPVNDAPVAADDGVFEVNENAPSTALHVLGNDSDIDSPTLTVSAVTQALNGSVSLEGGQVFYRPNRDWVGPDGFSYTLSDGALTATAVVRIFVLNVTDAPTLDPVADQGVVEDQTLLVTLTATDPRPAETFTYSIALLVNGAPAALPPGAALDAASGVFTWTPPEGAARPAPYVFEAAVTDSEGLADSVTFAVTVEPDVDLRLSALVSAAAADAGEGFSYHLTVRNADPNDPAEGVVVRTTLPAELAFDAAASSAACTAAGSAVTCAAGALQPGGEETFTLAVTVDPSLDGGIRVTQVFQAEGTGHEAYAADNAATVVTSLRVDLPVYEGGDTPGDEWSEKDVTQSPSGRDFMGEFNNQTITLTLEDLPQHSAATVTFDLLILRSWDGNQTQVPPRGQMLAPLAQVGAVIGPDVWELRVGGGAVLVHSTFANWGHLRQSFPSAYPEGDYPARTGAVESGTLGYDYYRITQMDSVYHFEITFLHSGKTLTLTFGDLGLQSIEDEAWGLDNVRVTVLSEQGSPNRVYLPVNGR